MSTAEHMIKGGGGGGADSLSCCCLCVIVYLTLWIPQILVLLRLTNFTSTRQVVTCSFSSGKVQTIEERGRWKKTAANRHLFSIPPPPFFSSSASVTLTVYFETSHSFLHPHPTTSVQLQSNLTFLISLSHFFI